MCASRRSYLSRASPFNDTRDPSGQISRARSVARFPQAITSSTGICQSFDCHAARLREFSSNPDSGVSISRSRTGAGPAPQST